ncbi:MAG: orotate phosphoribosyltransferase [Clostridiales bacterium]|jgi:orotate phosphoribosyltransferase|nr:orotate phosphoribosyltransferase [Clostridiales bacterium]
MALTNEQLLKIFESTGGVLKGHFLLTSGRHSDTYMQCAKLFVDPAVSEKLCAELAVGLKEFNANVVVSPAVGGIIMGYEVARALGVKNFFAERVDGKMTLRRGFGLNPGDRVVVVEDVVTTGGSVKEVIALCKDAGCNVVAAASIVDRSAGKVDFGVPYKALLSVEVLSYGADECPVCKTGAPLIKPGSRNLK